LGERAALALVIGTFDIKSFDIEPPVANVEYDEDNVKKIVWERMEFGALNP